ncbi:hypothetical protein SNEBB_004525 [Seison nebaliae]|nr:hypothetical protein SNEBB_004525 [Seison nebaliae]
MSKLFNSILSTASDVTSAVVGKDRLQCLMNKLDSSVLKKLKYNNIIQFVSVSSTRTLQIVRSASNDLVVDGIGGSGANFQNATWVVIPTGFDKYRFHNMFNYLGYTPEKHLHVIHIPMGQPIGKETEFLVHSLIGTKQLIMLESVAYPNIYLMIDDEGRDVSGREYKKHLEKEASFSVLVQTTSE